MVVVSDQDFPACTEVTSDKRTMLTDSVFVGKRGSTTGMNVR